MSLATIIAHTRFSRRSSLVTAVLRLPRMLLAEANTHRLPSRNAASARATPTKTTLEAERFVPTHWRRNRRGMEGAEHLPPEVAAECEARWLEDIERAKESVRFYAERGVLKGLANRPLDVYSVIPWLVTMRVEAVPHFLNLRNEGTAEDHFRDVVADFERALSESEPTPDVAHLPFIDDAERDEHGIYEALHVSAIRCRRVSIDALDTGKRPPWGEDFDKARDMKTTRPLHASPFEHQAIAVGGLFPWRLRKWAGNLALPDELITDFVQFRKTLRGEFMTERIRGR